MSVSLRQAISDDIVWLDGFYESLMRPYVELTHEWDDTMFKESFDPGKISIIQFDGKDIGMLKTEVREDHLFLCDIQIAKDYQGNGIGTSLVKQVIEDGRNKGLMVRLRVLKGNPAIRLYERLGFAEFEVLDNCIELVRKA